MTRTHDISFSYEVDELHVILDVEATVTRAPPGHSHPNDPDNDSECEITRVSVEDWDVDPDDVKLVRKDINGVREYWLLTDLLIETAWEQAERV